MAKYCFAPKSVLLCTKLLKDGGEEERDWGFARSAPRGGPYVAKVRRGTPASPPAWMRGIEVDVRSLATTRGPRPRWFNPGSAAQVSLRPLDAAVLGPQRTKSKNGSKWFKVVLAGDVVIYFAHRYSYSAISEKGVGAKS